MKKDAIRCYAQCICICSMIPVSKIKNRKKLPDRFMILFAV